jgi:hypothetical protein
MTTPLQSPPARRRVIGTISPLGGGRTPAAVGGRRAEHNSPGEILAGR